MRRRRIGQPGGRARARIAVRDLYASYTRWYRNWVDDKLRYLPSKRTFTAEVCRRGEKGMLRGGVRWIYGVQAGRGPGGAAMKDIERLSFVQSNGRKLNCWQVEAESLPHMQQERLGRAMADEAIAYMLTTGFTPLLVWVVQAMGGRLSPVPTGFFDEICRKAMKQGKKGPPG